MNVSGTDPHGNTQIFARGGHVTTIGRTIASRVLHDPAHCHCPRHFGQSKLVKIMQAVGPWIAYAVALWFLGVMCVWAVNGFPGFNRIH